MRARDIIEIENLQGRYMHILIGGNFETVDRLFADTPDTSFSFANKSRKPYLSKKELYEKMFLERMCRDFPEYDRFHAGGQITTPYIDVDEEGMHGFGMFPSFGFFVRGWVFGIKEPPYPVSIGPGMWYHEFIKENGEWKIHHFHAGTLVGSLAWTWSPDLDGGYAELGMARQMPAPPEPSGSDVQKTF